jgi:hypothetical protein
MDILPSIIHQANKCTLARFHAFHTVKALFQLVVDRRVTRPRDDGKHGLHTPRPAARNRGTETI